MVKTDARLRQEVREMLKGVDACIYRGAEDTVLDAVVAYVASAEARGREAGLAEAAKIAESFAAANLHNGEATRASSVAQTVANTVRLREQR